ncbi:amidase [Microdochium trichocladiopsis]|uniref:amidase n=1 Tax=Microdochium trichocladiopsis TaxID=1682393 RepID=A0A9P8Y3B6_9PEZI|nr:amidase [Microdochium trichocladiopsis]KAH7028921.1 amidase [Microdochium trichocladiopsis]
MVIKESNKAPARPWTDVVQAKRAERDALVAKHHAGNAGTDLLSSGGDPIVNVEQVTSLLAAGDITAEQLTRVYIARACEAHKKTNCLTEINFDNALEQARRLDEFRQTHGKLKGPLHGVPMSFKDQFNIKGLDTTMGYAGLAFAPAGLDCPLIETLEGLGAVIIAKTNLPQSIMWCETDNPLWGQTTHPANPALTSGGSSGGEGALLALGGSLVGWGTDIGGSIRIPSHVNGLWGLKPTSNRLSYRGVEVTQDGQQHVPSTIGPMATSLDSLVTTTRLVIEAAPWTIDPLIPPIPWRESILQDAASRTLVIGLVLDDGVSRVHPPIQRILTELVAALQAAGHEVIPWDISLNASCIEVNDAFYSADGGEDIRRAVEQGGEPFAPKTQAFVDRGKPISVYEYWQLNKKKVASQRAYNDMWQQARSPTSGRPVDILLMPTMPHTSTPHGTFGRWTGYTKLFNFLDYTALTFPAGVADKSKDAAYLDSGYVPRNTLDEWNWKLYDAELMDGLPVGLQIVGRKYEEEKVLGAAQQIQKHL